MNIDTQRVKEDEFLFYLVTFASFIEIASDTYSKMLSNYFADNGEATSWLCGDWEQEEVQHGRAKIIQVMYQRLSDVDSQDIFLAYKAIHSIRNEGTFEREAYDAYKANFTLYAKQYYPKAMAVKMLMQPLQLSKTLEAAMIPAIKGAMRIVGF
jgi:hypothetical protein